MAFCSSCGKELVPEVKFCPECGASVSEGAVEGLAALRQREPSVETPAPASAHAREDRTPRIDNHLAKAIIATLLCCMPFGIIAIVHASSVDGKVHAGDLNGARLASRKANDWGNYAIISGFIVAALYCVFMVFAAGMGSF